MSVVDVDVAQYHYGVEWSAEGAAFVGTCVEFASLSWLEPSRDAALQGIQQLVADVVRKLGESGEPAPRPLAGVSDFSTWSAPSAGHVINGRGLASLNIEAARLDRSR